MHILVVGATGRLGSKVVTALLAAKADVRVAHRASSKPEAVQALRDTDATLVAVDVADPASMVRACEGVDVVVSTIQGLRDAIVDGQTAVLRAAEQANVPRMIPSDYALDFFKTDDGGNRNLDLRREFNRTLDASRVRGTSVLCGAFMDLIAFGAIGPDPAGVYRVWGDADQPYDFTFTDDVAQYIAAAALDADAPRMVRVAGDTKTPRELGELFAEARGKPVTVEIAGSVADLDQAIARLRATDNDPENHFPPWQRMQYVRDMASGRGRLAPLDNARYPQVKPRTIRELLASMAAR